MHSHGPTSQMLPPITDRAYGTQISTRYSFSCCSRAQRRSPSWYGATRADVQTLNSNLTLGPLGQRNEETQGRQRLQPTLSDTKWPSCRTGH
jgi:hypothetical protein